MDQNLLPFIPSLPLLSLPLSLSTFIEDFRAAFSDEDQCPIGTEHPAPETSRSKVYQHRDKNNMAQWCHIRFISRRGFSLDQSVATLL